jgi:hypothetical protein
VRQRWAAAGACLLDTAREGALVFAAPDGGRLRLVRRQRADGAHLWTTPAPPFAGCPAAAGP